MGKLHILRGGLLLFFVGPVLTAEFRCPSLGVQRDPTDCSRFFVCSAVPGTRSLQAVPVVCPRGTVFSREAGACDLISRVPECHQAPCSPGSLSPHPTSCTQYLQCPTSSPSRTVVSNCPASSVFSPSLSRCSSTSSAFSECFARTFRCPHRRPPSLAPLPGLCTHYLRCSPYNPAPAILQCPAGHWFHPRRLICVIPPATATCPTPFLCPFAGYFPVTSDCSSYHACPRAGVIGPVTRCPMGYFLAGNQLGCRPTSQVPECSSEGVPRCLVQGRFHYPHDCRRFVVCQQVRDTLVQTGYECPQGFYFDFDRGVCDFAARVRCTSSQVRVWQ